MKDLTQIDIMVQKALQGQTNTDNANISYSPVAIISHSEGNKDFEAVITQDDKDVPTYKAFYNGFQININTHYFIGFTGFTLTKSVEDWSFYI